MRLSAYVNKVFVLNCPKWVSDAVEFSLKNISILKHQIQSFST